MARKRSGNGSGSAPGGRRDGGGRRRGRHPGLPGPGQLRLLRPPGGDQAGHRRGHGPAGQDLPHQRLLHVHHLPQAGGMRPASEHRDPYPDRGAGHQRRAGQLHGHPEEGAPLRGPGQVHRLRGLRQRLPGDHAGRVQRRAWPTGRRPTASIPRPSPRPSASRSWTGPPAPSPARRRSTSRATCSSSRWASTRRR